MIVENINKKHNKPRILLAPLDWGLGHATRCIPLIATLLKQNAEVIIAAEGDAASILKKEFPSLVILPLKGYRIRYSRQKQAFWLKMALQLPRILRATRYENKWLAQCIKEHQIDGVISDNRLGFCNSSVPCIFITHQLYIETGISFINRTMQKINYHFINRFNECWVPDDASGNNLAGKLSHPSVMPAIPVHYLGILSRFEPTVTHTRFDLLILLSGPEPQRSIFETLLCDQLKNYEGSVVLVRGLPRENNSREGIPENVVVYNHLQAAELNLLIQQSAMIVARCGYSTVMDLVSLQKNAVLVPTPGQGEQEYLASYLFEKKLFYTTPQAGFNLDEVLNAARTFKVNEVAIRKGPDEKLVANWLQQLKTRQ
jgi:UDP-N-acetylglucosamine transferase subunit ALG13